MTPESMAEAKMGYGIERPKAFIDAVVAIALTFGQLCGFRTAV